MNKQQDIIIYNTADGKASVALYAKDGVVWMSQNQLAELFNTSKQNISLHIANTLKYNELQEKSVVKDYLTTASDGKKYKVAFYALEMVLAVGYRVKSIRGVQFRTWATDNLKEYMVKGFLVDDERLKNPDGRPDYFDELLAKIRDIRASEKRFYQKVRDLLSLSSDYDKTDKSTQMFFAQTQNKLLYAVTNKTAAELILERANKDQPNMALTCWQGSVVRKQDIFIAKNYLSKDEIDTLNRLVVIFLETAELRVKNRQDITLNFWQENVNKMLDFNDKKILTTAGTISNSQMKQKVTEIYTLFDKDRKINQAREADLQELEVLENNLKSIKKNN